MPPMRYLNANYGGDAPPQSRMNTRRMPGGDSSPFSASPTPTWDSAPPPLIPGGAEPFLEQPRRSPGNASVNKTDPSRWAGTEGPAEILSDETPDNDWIPGADYAADGIITSLGPTTRERRPSKEKIQCRLRLRGRLMRRRRADSMCVLSMAGVTNLMCSTDNIMMRRMRYWTPS